ncbi:MAG: M23 family metallopeptidase [Clostridia bacterium]|nr:M23 family metallopeptidase [Clostridia bacterium]
MEKQNKIVQWFKKYGTYATAAVLVVAIAGVILVTGLSANVQKVNTSAKNPVVSVGTIPLTFSMPMANAQLLKDYSSEELFFSKTLGRWEFHDGIDLVSSDMKVFAVADGEVVDVENSSLYGTTITIKHTDGLSSVYGSLNSTVLVKEGDKVKAGTELGAADNTATNESADGKHLHFAMIENNKKIDPANYLEFESK